MNDRSLERNVDSAKSIIDDLVYEIESLENQLEIANDKIDKLEEIIDEFNNIGS